MNVSGYTRITGQGDAGQPGFSVLHTSTLAPAPPSTSYAQQTRPSPRSLVRLIFCPDLFLSAARRRYSLATSHLLPLHSSRCLQVCTPELMLSSHCRQSQSLVDSTKSFPPPLSRIRCEG